MLIFTGSSSERNIKFPSDEGPTLETFDFTIRDGSTPILLYFDFFLNDTYTQHSLFHKTYLLKQREFSSMLFLPSLQCIHSPVGSL